MELFLMVATISLLGFVVTIGLFAAATAGGSATVEERVPARAEARRRAAAVAATASGPPMFFVQPARGDRAADKVPLEVLLLQIERHVRLEQAAAESFLDAPTVQALHTRTTSPLLH